MKLSTKIAWALAVALAAALSLATVLNVLRFEETVHRLLGQRLEVMLVEVERELLSGLDLGLRLANMESLPLMLQRRLQMDPDLMALEVFACDGRLLARAARVQAGGPQPLAALPVGRTVQYTETYVQASVPLLDGLSQCAGALRLTLDAGAQHALVARAGATLWRAAAWGMLTLLPVWGLLFWQMRQRQRLFRRLLDDVHSLENGVPAPFTLDERGALTQDERHMLSAYRQAREPLLAGEAPPLASIRTEDGASTGSARTEDGRVGVAGERAPGSLRRLMVVGALALVLALGGISWRAILLAEQDLWAEMNRKAALESLVLGEKLERALGYGIPLEGLQGFEAVFAGLKAGDDDLAFAAIVAHDGRLLHVAGAMPGEAAAASAHDEAFRVGLVEAHILTERVLPEGASLLLAHDRAALSRPVTDNLVDIGIILLVALALSFEWMLLVTMLNVVLPVRVATRVLERTGRGRFDLSYGQGLSCEVGRLMEGVNRLIARAAHRVGARPQTHREPRLVGVRLLAFMFVFAEELARPVMPAFFAGFGGAGLDGHMVAGMVMAVQLLTVALAMPLCSLLQGRMGARRMYLSGAVLATAGLFATAYAPDLFWLLLCRMLSALGYATAFVACQGHVLGATDDSNRAQGTAMMVAGIMLADICGPAVGGIVANHVGHEATFMLGGAMAALSVGLALLLMDPPRTDAPAPPRPTRAAFVGLLGNRPLLGLLMFAAVPAKLILSGFLYYLVPLSLYQAGANMAEVGRVIILYGLGAFATGWLIARWSDRRQAELRVVGAAATVSALALLMAGLRPDMLVMALAVVVLGVAQGASIPAQMAGAMRLAQPLVAQHGTGPLLAVMRLTERLGAAAGPLLAAALTLWFGFDQAVLMLAALALLCVLGLRWTQSDVRERAHETR